MSLPCAATLLLALVLLVVSVILTRQRRPDRDLLATSRLATTPPCLFRRSNALSAGRQQRCSSTSLSTRMLPGLTIATSRYCKGFAILRLASIPLFLFPTVPACFQCSRCPPASWTAFSLSKK